jgi:phosphoglycolate phosphatase-like HAD superfamily hydrolase
VTLVARNVVAKFRDGPTKSKITLITFDVDGTLVHGSSSAAEISSHAKAFSYGVGKTFSTDLNEFQVKHPYPLAAIDGKYYHGSTDGLIVLHFARATCDTPPSEGLQKLSVAFRHMYDYIARLPDSEMCRGIEALPGVVDTLHKLANDDIVKDHVLCGLVTGNVEGIARKKMRAVGILATGVLSRKAAEQDWDGENDAAFLGGFGSDYCSGDLSDYTRNYKDRGEQIVIAYKRAKSLLSDHQEIVRVVHVGDAPSDVLAAKYCAEENKLGDGVVMSCIAVATGKFTATDLSSLFSDVIPGKWEPHLLENGVADPSFLEKCCIPTDDKSTIS